MIAVQFKGEISVDNIILDKNKNICGQLAQLVDNCVASLLVC